MATTQSTGQVATAATNDITGARLVSRAPTQDYKDGWERIFGNKDKPKENEADSKED